MYSMAVVVECCLKHRRIGVASVQLLYTPTVRSQRKRKDYIHVTPKRNNDDRISCIYTTPLLFTNSI